MNGLELYKEDLQMLQTVMDYLEDVTNGVEGLFSVEIRVKPADISSWIVIGWGEDGHPCVLRFEQDTPPPAPKKTPNQTILPSVPGILWNDYNTGHQL